jgi:hypothetical protein
VTLRFGSGDEDAYYAARDALLDEVGSLLPPRQGAHLVSDIGLLLDWRYHYSNGVLDEFAHSHVAEFLLEWCPRKVARSGKAADELCTAFCMYVDFMARTNRLVGGADRAARLTRVALDLLPSVREEMDNPANFGMSKTLLDGLDLSGFSEEELHTALNARMNEINALPYAERKALTDRFFDAGDDPDLDAEPYELPFVYIPPPLADVEAAAAASPLLAKVEALRDYLGADGKPLTDKGNLKLADGRALIGLLDTGDEMDPEIGGKTWRTGSTTELRRLNFILDVAKETGAIRVHKRRLVPVKAWTAISNLQRAAALGAATIELGPLESERSGRIWYFDELHELLDDGIVHWLAPLLGEPELPFDNIVGWALPVVAQRMAPDVPHLDAQRWEKFTRRDVSHIFEILEMAGLVRWTDRVEVPVPYGLQYWTDGAVTLTALGRHVLPDYLDGAGYVLHRADDVADSDGAALIDAMLSVDDMHHEALIASWQPDRPAVERAQMLTEAIAASGGKSRVMGFVALQMFDIEVVEPLVRQLLDTQAAGHAALWLISQGRAEVETLGSFVDVGVLVDVLSGDLDDPEELCSVFMASPDPLELIEGMWRHPAPETALVLDALGHHMSDKALAKAARKAAMRHRSWMANR